MVGFPASSVWFVSKNLCCGRCVGGGGGKRSVGAGEKKQSVVNLTFYSRYVIHRSARVANIRKMFTVLPMSIEDGDSCQAR